MPEVLYVIQFGTIVLECPIHRTQLDMVDCLHIKDGAAVHRLLSFFILLPDGIDSLTIGNAVKLYLEERRLFMSFLIAIRSERHAAKGCVQCIKNIILSLNGIQRWIKCSSTGS